MYMYKKILTLLDTPIVHYIACNVIRMHDA